MQKSERECWKAKGKATHFHKFLFWGCFVDLEDQVVKKGLYLAITWWIPFGKFYIAKKSNVQIGKNFNQHEPFQYRYPQMLPVTKTFAANSHIACILAFLIKIIPSYVVNSEVA